MCCQGNLSELQMSAQNSRVSVLANGALGSTTVKGFVETDFLGNAPTALQVTANSTSFDETVTTDTDGTPIGYGIQGSTSANHTLYETTLGATQTLFRDSRVGTLQLLAQYSNVSWTPFSVPSGTPSHTTTNMIFIDVRYILP